MQHATPTRDCRVEDPGVGPVASDTTGGGAWVAATRGGHAPREGRTPGHHRRGPRSAPVPWESRIARVGPSPMTPRAQVGLRNREWWYLAPHQAAAGWFQTTSQDAPRGSPKPPYTRGSASPLGKSHGGVTKPRVAFNAPHRTYLASMPKPLCARVAGSGIAHVEGSCRTQPHYTYCMYYLLSKLYKKHTAKAFWRASWLCSPQKTETIGLG